MMKFIQNRKGPNIISIDCTKFYDYPSSKPQCPLSNIGSIHILNSKQTILGSENLLKNLEFVGITFLGKDKSNYEDWITLNEH